MNKHTLIKIENLDQFPITINCFTSFLFFLQ